MGSVRTLDDHTPVQGLPLAASASESRAMDMDDLRPDRGSPRVPAWLLGLALIGGMGGGGGVAAGLGALGSSDVERLRRDVDDQDNELEALRREQVYQHRWVAGELIKQSRAIGKVGEKVGAEVDVEVSQYQSEGL